MNYSNWLNVDLHIHSIKSNDVKKNDYEGQEYSAEELLDKLLEKDNDISLFSITDHNCINTKLYNDIQEKLKTDEYKDKINCLIGVELDVNDSNVYDENFHCLCFFDTDDVLKVEKTINDIFNSNNLDERDNISCYPDINKIFKSFTDNSIKNIILIPHYHNKKKGLSIKAVEKLNYLCFDAYEDANNINKISESLSIYLKDDCGDFPFTAFSDCHNINIYPKGKDKTENIKCSVLGNIKYSFNSIKTAFQEPRLRVGLENIPNMRQTKCPERYLESLIINEEPLELSPYQNTIIGKFGSGKTLLLETIKKGYSQLQYDEKYNDFYKKEGSFKISIGNAKYDSLNEAINVNYNLKRYDYIQQENYYYKNYLSKLELNNLLLRLNLETEYLDDKKFDFNEEEFNLKYNSFINYIQKEDCINNINYEMAFNTEEYFTVSTSFTKLNLDDVIDAFENSSLGLFDIKDYLIDDDILIFNAKESAIIDNCNKLIKDKLIKLKFINNCSLVDDIKTLINDYNDKYIKNNAKESKNRLINDINLLNNNIIEFNDICNSVEITYDKNRFDELCLPVEKNINDEYKIIGKYSNSNEYKNIVSSIIQESNRKSNLFKSILKTESNDDTNKRTYIRNDTILNLINKFFQKAQEMYKSDNAVYDIYNKSGTMLKKSAGEKSSLFIEFIFSLIEADLKRDINVILLIDQPEDNIDNENIYKEITKKIKKFKLLYNKFQIIVITHNANIGITSDSENIIIAEETVDTASGAKKFKYKNGCIENKEYIKSVCDILEGGDIAMEKRALKYGINTMKKVMSSDF